MSSWFKKILKKEPDKEPLADKEKVEVKVEAKKPASKKVERFPQIKKEKQSEIKREIRDVHRPVTKKDDLFAHQIILKPLITEKATDLTQFNKYSFIVPVTATKSEIKEKIINIYGVKPLKINLVKVKGKNVRFGRTQGRQKDWKKAIITLAAEEKIEIYEGV